jgi:preprotein translocase subunit SecF
MIEEKKQSLKHRIAKFHDKNYKILLLIPVIILVFSFAYMAVFYSNNGDFVHKDFSLTGGTSITIIGDINADELKNTLSEKLNELNTREIYDLTTRDQTALIVQTTTNSDEAEEILEEYLGYKLTGENSSFEFISPTLGENFYKGLLISISIAFVFMALIVFILFRNLTPSAAVIISAFADIFMTLTLVNLLGIKLSSAGLVAFLMLIGYSVDTDILLTSKILKRHDNPLNERFFSAFKTGITMTVTSLLAVIFALVVATSFSVVLTQIFMILAIGLGFDILNTWITNASLLKWYIKSKEGAK